MLDVIGKAVTSNILLGHRDVPSILQSDVGGRCWIATARLDGRLPNYQLLITAASWRRQYQKLGLHHPPVKRKHPRGTGTTLELAGH